MGVSLDSMDLSTATQTYAAFDAETFQSVNMLFIQDFSDNKDAVQSALFIKSRK